MNSRIKLLVLGTLVLGSVVFATPAFAASPANDNFATAAPVAGSSGATSGTTIGATNEAAEPTGGSLGVWYSWQPSVSGATTFQTCGAASYDSWVEVFTGSSLGSLTLVASGDDGCGSGSRASLVAFRAQAGTRYWIRVSGYNGQEGTFTLSWAVQTNDDLETPQVVGTGHSGSVSGSTLGATDQPGETPTSSGGLWYSWTAPGAGTVTFDTCAGAEFDTVVDAYAGAAIATLAQVAHNDDACGPVAPGDHGRLSSVTFATTAGTTYSIRVSGSPGTAPNGGHFTLSWSYTGPDTTTVTPTSLCLLTAQYVRSSGRYQGLGLTPLQQAQVDSLVASQCDGLGRLVARLTPYQKAIYVAVYKLVVSSLTAGTWLTPAQRTTLFALADRL